MDDRAAAIVRFWFGEPGSDIRSHAGRWFTKDPSFDDDVRSRFSAVIDHAQRGDLDGWAKGEAREALALVILLDQFPRNVFRDAPRAFAGDARALDVCLNGQTRGVDRTLSFIERYIFYMPMMHAEDRDVQRLAVAAFAQLVEDARTAGAPSDVQDLVRDAHDYAVRHARVIERFGRFPHRNPLLERVSTPEEAAFLAEGARF